MKFIYNKQDILKFDQLILFMYYILKNIILIGIFQDYH